MKAKRLRISFELLRELFTAGAHSTGYTVEQDAIPADAQLVNVRHGWPNEVELLIASDTFPYIKAGDEVPELTPIIRRIDSKPLSTEGTHA